MKILIIILAIIGLYTTLLQIKVLYLRIRSKKINKFLAHVKDLSHRAKMRNPMNEFYYFYLKDWREMLYSFKKLTFKNWITDKTIWIKLELEQLYWKDEQK